MKTVTRSSIRGTTTAKGVASADTLAEIDENQNGNLFSQDVNNVLNNVKWPIKEKLYLISFILLHGDTDWPFIASQFNRWLAQTYSSPGKTSQASLESNKKSIAQCTKQYKQILKNFTAKHGFCDLKKVYNELVDQRLNELRSGMLDAKQDYLDKYKEIESILSNNSLSLDQLTKVWLLENNRTLDSGKSANKYNQDLIKQIRICTTDSEEKKSIVQLNRDIERLLVYEADEKKRLDLEREKEELRIKKEKEAAEAEERRQKKLAEEERARLERERRQKELEEQKAAELKRQQEEEEERRRQEEAALSKQEDDKANVEAELKRKESSDMYDDEDDIPLASVVHARKQRMITNKNGSSSAKEKSIKEEPCQEESASAESPMEVTEIGQDDSKSAIGKRTRGSGARQSPTKLLPPPPPPPASKETPASGQQSPVKKSLRLNRRQQGLQSTDESFNRSPSSSSQVANEESESKDVTAGSDSSAIPPEPSSSSTNTRKTRKSQVPEPKVKEEVEKEPPASRQSKRRSVKSTANDSKLALQSPSSPTMSTTSSRTSTTINSRSTNNKKDLTSSSGLGGNSSSSSYLISLIKSEPVIQPGDSNSPDQMGNLNQSNTRSSTSNQLYSSFEDEKAYKSWKKSIMMVYTNIACHKHATIFMQPVKEDIAPGYKRLVHRPMDLSTIKKNLESGQIKSTVEFQRDIMLMFTNAIMYNSSNYDIHKIALEMYKEVVSDIEQLLNAQEPIGDSDSKLLRFKDIRSSTTSERNLNLNDDKMEAQDDMSVSELNETASIRSSTSGSTLLTSNSTSNSNNLTAGKKTAAASVVQAATSSTKKTGGRQQPQKSSVETKEKEQPPSSSSSKKRASSVVSSVDLNQSTTSKEQTNSKTKRRKSGRN